MVFINQWRLPILFVVSGMGTRFALSYRSGAQFVKERSVRLIVPLAFGMLVVVAPQVYIERLTQGQNYASFFDFYPHYFNGTYPQGNFSWHHLWFLPYLFVYSFLLAPVFIALRNAGNSAFISGFKKLLKTPVFLYLLIVPLVFIEYYMRPVFPLTRNLTSDWYGFAHYIFFFFYGYLFISVKEEFWQATIKIRRIALVAGIILFALLLWAWETNPPYVYESIISVANMWSWILAILGYGALYLNKNSRLLSYCNQAVYPFYILHQTVMMIFAYYVINLEASISLKFVGLSIVTFSGCWILFELIRRNNVSRFLFGMKPKEK